VGVRWIGGVVAFWLQSMANVNRSGLVERLYTIQANIQCWLVLGRNEGCVTREGDGLVGCGRRGVGLRGLVGGDEQIALRTV